MNQKTMWEANEIRKQGFGSFCESIFLRLILFFAGHFLFIKYDPKAGTGIPFGLFPLLFRYFMKAPVLYLSSSFELEVLDSVFREVSSYQELLPHWRRLSAGF